MPTQSLIDFEKLDLSRVIFDSDHVRKHCKQRGRFALLDGILHFDHEGGLLVGYKDLTLSDWWVPDHIPGRPIFPGALQAEGAAQLASFDYLERRPELAGAFLGFAGLDAVRFRGVVEPPGRIVFAAKVKQLRTMLFRYSAQAFVDRELVFEGEILGVVL